MSNRIKSGEIQIGNNYVLPIEQSNVTRQQAKVKKIIEETDAMAQKIIEYRNSNGDFNNTSDIKNVPGIGNAKYEAIKDEIDV